ncbi:MAG: PD-(D/E)XK nuclease family protein, partial [Myxococcaceae bacterium]
DADGTGGCAAFARELIALADADPTEAQADVLDAGDPRAVQLLTIHQSKGLEWPIVVVPDLAAQRANETARVRFDRALGLSIKPWVPDQGVAQSPRFSQFVQEQSLRTQAEHRRLLYVALTRARDQLVLSGQTTRSKGTWRGWIDAAIDARPALRALVRDVDVESLPREPAPPPAKVPASVSQLARVDRVIEHVRQPLALRPAGVVLPVTQLQDYFTCPRRYLYAHQVGLSEFPVVFDLDGGEPDDTTGRSPGDRRLRGTLAHRLLEQVDLWKLRGKPEVLRKQLEGLLWAEGLAAKSEDAVEIIQWVESFLASDFAGRLAKAGAPRVHRELPFLLRLGDAPAVHLKGQIDLLFEDEEGGATVVDYKASRPHPAGLDAYRFQLDCYALAARRFVQEGVSIRTGIVFLRGSDREPQLRQGSADFPALEQTLYSGAVELLERSRTHAWPGLERSACEALRCGYQYRCHVGGV